MTVSRQLDIAIDQFAQCKGISLSPHWKDEWVDKGDAGGAQALAGLCVQLGWVAPIPLATRPRADQFPLLAWSADLGWVVAEQWENNDAIRLAGLNMPLLVPDEGTLFVDLNLPDPLGQGEAPRAITIFWRAIMRRKHVLVMAALATTFANILAIATSLYSMQLFDRVIPLGSYNTLYVLTVGVGMALLLEAVLRTVRAVMIEREAAEIDAEISEYFFARSQAVRLDARPPGIGTLAAQLRGLDQVRSVMSSASLFMLADLPFALFFIFVVAALGGVVAIVPVLSLPIAIALALGMARLIRAGTDRAQVSGNRKNGMLVESLDAAETVKANRGGWFLLGRWNRLVRDVHHYEDPVKRTSAIANTLFATLQQVAYVAIMAVGAIQVGAGNLTTGGLLACSILAGRINGPLVAMLPNLIVQWGYARSSLSSLDAILRLPLDRSSGEKLIRPDDLAGAVHVDGLRFAYPQARESLEIPRLEIRPGERVAVIGGVGSGKTTLLRHLAGLYAPQSGSIRIGGLDVAHVADDVLRHHIGYLPQDFRLVNGSLRENLLMGLPTVSDSAIMDVAKRTALDQLIGGHPMGLDLAIQEGGRGLSGGQRSLVGINRLIHANPRIWLLDEPTASLDQASELAVFEALDRAMTLQSILVVVTHRIQLLSRFPRTILMGNGRVLMDGPTGAVLARLQAQSGANTQPPAGPQGQTVSIRR